MSFFNKTHPHRFVWQDDAIATVRSLRLSPTEANYMGTQPYVFFEDDKTLSALNELASAKHLVIYCGAGTTIDRTGTSWEQLIAHLVNENNSPESSLIHRVIRESNGEEAGSIAWESLAADRSEPNETIDRYLTNILYDKIGWSKGNLLDNLAHLAVTATLANRRVTIVTTNYDVYIEEAFKEYLKELTKYFRNESHAIGFDSQWELPGLQVRYYRRSKHRGTYEGSKVIRNSQNTDRMVELVYVHGRLGKSYNQWNTHVVLTERDYALSHARTVNTLMNLIDKDSGFLIVGSSIRDKPLIDALVRSQAHTKVALLRLSTWLKDKKVIEDHNSHPTKSIRESAVKILGYRGTTLGNLKFIATENHEQISQFTEELSLAIEAQTYDNKTWPIKALSYRTRVATWFNNWQRDRPTPDDEYSILADFLKDHSGYSISKEKESETFFTNPTRIEVWARVDGDITSRSLQLVCSSSGPLRSTYVPRQCNLNDESVAAARAFNEGRPLILSLRDLHLEPSSSRWQTFMSVPVFVGDYIDYGEGYFAGAPVGTVVVASTHERPSFTCLSSSCKGKMVERLENLGLTILVGATS